MQQETYPSIACGYTDRTPTEAHFIQMKKRTGATGFQQIEAWLRKEALRIRKDHPLSAVGLVQAAYFNWTEYLHGAAEIPTRQG
ncbi:hypothetical protein GF319_12665 [Candidatus Bathyarchaeota archaeon]|nr:hypothetical protein [Candidatus Bathyarchaeota archaeon]